MAAPTRAEIQAQVARPTFLVEVKRSGSWVDVSADVVESATRVESATGPNGLGFGAYVAPRATVTLAREQIVEDWELLPIRISYGFASSDKPQQFVGVILKADSGSATVSYDCAGYDAIIARSSVYSPLVYRRPIATETTLTSIDDPNDVDYAGGMVNFILWNCGGRPIEQVVSYPSADFYYSCDRAIIAPDWSWTAGENNWTELQRLCQAAGGQIYQASDGVVYYVEPLMLADGSTGHVFTDAAITDAARVSGNLGSYGDISVSASAEDAVSGVECRFTQRRVLGVQEVYRDKPDLYMPDGDVTTLVINTQLPLYDVARVEVRACKLRGGPVLTEAIIDPLLISVNGQRTLLGLTNALGFPIVVYEVALFGRPLGAIEEGSASYTGSTSRPYATVRQIPDSPLIQTASHAKRLCRMYYDFTAAATAVISLTGCGFDPDRYVGETVGLTSAAHGYSALACRIVAIDEQGGASMDVVLAPVGGLPKRSNCWIVGTSYSGANTRELAY